MRPSLDQTIEPTFIIEEFELSSPQWETIELAVRLYNPEPNTLTNEYTITLNGGVVDSGFMGLSAGERRWESWLIEDVSREVQHEVCLELDYVPIQ